VTLNRTAKFALTAALFVVAIVVAGIANATKEAAPLFFAWIPLLAVPWVLTRPESRPTLTEPAEPTPLAEAETEGGTEPPSGAEGAGSSPSPAEGETQG